MAKNLVKICVAVAVFVAVAECSNFFRHLQRQVRESEPIMDPFPSYFCLTQLERCAQPYEEQYAVENFEDAKAIFSSEARLSQLCLDIRALQSCKNTVVEENGCDFPDFNTVSEELDLVTEYLCNTTTQELILAASQSQCFANEAALAVASEQLMLCTFPLVLGDFSDASQICPAIQSLRVCVIHKAETHCGSDVAAFAENFLQFALEEMKAVEKSYGTEIDMSCLTQPYSQESSQAPIAPPVLRHARRSLNLAKLVRSLYKGQRS